MKISQSEVSLFSFHNKKHEIIEQEDSTQLSRDEDEPPRLEIVDRLELSDKFTNMIKVDKLNSEIQEDLLDPKLKAILMALEYLMDIKVNISFLSKFSAKNVVNNVNIPHNAGVSHPVEQAQKVQKREIIEESVNFSASGNLKTEDGKNIHFSLALNIHGKSVSYQSLSGKDAASLIYIDPLVLNFYSTTVNITDVKHKFDLDLDGKSDEFSFVGSGSGFLAIDKNKDGIINDGSELFGPKSGNGFNELRAYDTDRNNWIDENDDVFKQLLIWTKDENGDENLFSLSDKDIGAMYLGSASTSFDLRVNNELGGQLKESSIFISEDGTVGTLQEIDLVV